MLPSEAMLKGFEMAGGRQCKRALYKGSSTQPTAVCAEGALNLGMNNDAEDNTDIYSPLQLFLSETGATICTANDKGMSIPDIAGILASEGY